MEPPLPPTTAFSSDETRYLEYLNSTHLDSQSITFKLHAHENSTTTATLWKILRYQPTDSKWAKAHRNALLLLRARGATFSNEDFSHLNAPRLEFQRPISLENALLAKSFLPGINLTGACLRGANLTDAVLTGAKLGVYHLRHSKHIQCAAFHDNYSATVDTGQTLHLWNHNKGILVYKKSRSVNLKTIKMLFSNDGNLLFVVELKLKQKNYVLAVWKCLPLEKMLSVKLSQRKVIQLACSFDDNFLIIRFNYSPSLAIYKLIRDKNSIRLIPHGGVHQEIEHLCVSPTHLLLGTAQKETAGDGNSVTHIIFWKIDPLEKSGQWEETCEIESLEFASDGRSLVISETGNDSKVYTRSIEQGRRYDLFFDTKIKAITFGHTTSLFAYLTDDRNLCVRSVYTKDILSRLEISAGKIFRLFLSNAETELVAVQDNVLTVWQISEIHKLWKTPFEKGIDGIAFNPSCELIYIFSLAKFKLVRYSVITGIALDSPLPSGIQNVLQEAKEAFLLANGDTIAFKIRQNRVVLYSISKEKIYWDHSTRDELWFDCSEDGSYVVILTESKIEVWTTQKKKKIRSIAVSIANTFRNKPVQGRKIACGLDRAGEGHIAIASTNMLHIFRISNENLIHLHPIRTRCKSLQSHVNPNLLVWQDAASLKITCLSGVFQTIELPFQGSCYAFSPSENILIHYFYTKQKKLGLSNLTGHIVQISRISELKIEKLNEFQVDFAVSGIRWASNSREFVLWGSDTGCFQMRTFIDNQQKLLWSVPSQLDVEELQTEGLIADEITENELRFPKKKPQNLAQLKKLIHTENLQNKINKILSYSSTQLPKNEIIGIKLSSILVVLKHLKNQCLEDIGTFPLSGLAVELRFCKTEFNLITYLRLMEVDLLIEKLTAINSLNEKSKNALIYHYHLLTQEALRIKKYIEYVNLKKAVTNWANYDSDEQCGLALQQVKVDWESFQYEWIHEYQVPALYLTTVNYFTRLDVHERIRLIDLAIAALYHAP